MAGALFEQNGAQHNRNSVDWTTLAQDWFFSGLCTNRNQLHPVGSIAEQRYYGGRSDAILGGKNVFINSQLEIQRRPGHSEFSSFVYPTAPLYAYSFAQNSGAVWVIIDTGTSGSLTLTSVGAASGGQSVYHGTFPAGGSSAYSSMYFTVQGFTGAQNNGANFKCVASTTTTLTLQNPNATAETTAASCSTAGGVWYDQQNGSATFLWGKLNGAGQTGFVSLANILYAGDGISCWSFNPLTTGSNGTVFSYGIAAPTAAPTYQIIPSASASVGWTASCQFTPMGLCVDTVNSITYSLVSVNNAGNNTTQFGTSGAGAPAFAALSGTITDNTITWTTNTAVSTWQANTTYQNFAQGGTATSNAAIYDPVTKGIYVQSTPGNAAGKSGAVAPKFKPQAGAHTIDNQITWIWCGTPSTSSGAPGLPGLWLPNTSYPKVGSISDNICLTAVVAPVSLLSGLPTNQTVYVITSSGGTSGAGNISPFNANTAVAGFGSTVGDNQLVWMNLGSSTWSASASVAPWTAVGSPFTAILDPNGNMQFVQSGTVTAAVEPGTSYTLTSVQANTPTTGQATYNFSAATAPPVGQGNLPFYPSGFSNAGNNSSIAGFPIISSTGSSVVVTNSGAVNETHAGVGVYNPFQAGFGNVTVEASGATWVCVGSKTTWTENQKFYLPVNGFYPPSQSDPYSVTLNDSNGDSEGVVNPGISGGSAPSWGAIGTYTSDNGSSFTLSAVATNADGTSTFTGTGLSGLAGQQLLISGFVTNPGNNGKVVVLSQTPWAPTATTFHVKTSSQVTETHAAIAKNGLQYYNIAAAESNSLAFNFGICFAYSFKSRSLSDYYSTQQTTVSAAGVTSTSLPIPSGLSNPLPFPPSGSQIGDVSTCSPSVQITGSNGGCVINLSGLGSTNLAVDTLVIFASPDSADGSGSMLEAVEIPAPPPVGGVASPWTYAYYLPFVPATINGVNYSGLDTLVSAPVGHANDQPPNGFTPFIVNFNRTWGTYKNSVIWSEGEDSTTGNSFSQFLPSDAFFYQANPVALVKTTQMVMVCTPSSYEIIGGGPETSTFFQQQFISGIGLNSRNCIGQFGGEIFAFASDNSLRAINPNVNLANIGFPIADLLSNAPTTGIADATWNPSNAYLAVLQYGNDNIIALADGATGYYTVNPRQLTNSANITDPVWSPYASIIGGAGMVCTVETAPGVRRMLVGSPTGGNVILRRDVTVNTDNNSEYDAFFVEGALQLAKRGEAAKCVFIEGDFSGQNYQPAVSFLFDELYNSTTQNSFNTFTLAPQFDPPWRYGNTMSPVTFSPNRYYFAGVNVFHAGVYLTIKVDFGTTSNADAIYSLSLVGKLAKH